MARDTHFTWGTVTRSRGGWAVDKARAIITDIHRGQVGIFKKRKDPTFEEAVKLFFENTHIRRNNTKRFYETCFKRLGEYFSGKKEWRLSKISDFTIEGYKKHRIAKGATIRLNRELTALRRLFNVCIQLGEYDGDNPLAKLQFPFPEKDEREEEPRFLDEAEQERLIKSLSGAVQTMIIAGLNGGFRCASELFPLKWRAVEFGKKRIIVESNYSKNHRRRAVPMNSALYKAMHAHYEGSKKTDPDDHVFVSKRGTPFKSIRTPFETARRKAKLGPMSPCIATGIHGRPT